MSHHLTEPLVQVFVLGFVKWSSQRKHNEN